MVFTDVLLFNMALGLAILSPGPAMLAAMHITLSQSRAKGITFGLGLAVMAVIWTALALLGLETIFSLFPFAYGALKITGAAYLLYLAWSMWRGANAPLAQITQKPASNTFWQGFMVNALNPKSVLFATAMITTIFPKNLLLWEKAIILSNHFIIEIAFYSTLALGIGTTALRQRYTRAKATLDRSAALLLGFLGVRLLWDFRKS